MAEFAKIHVKCHFFRRWHAIISNLRVGVDESSNAPRDLNLLLGMASVQQKMYRVGKQLVIGRTKTAKSRRAIPCLRCWPRIYARYSRSRTESAGAAVTVRKERPAQCEGVSSGTTTASPSHRGMDGRCTEATLGGGTSYR
jgi:hypothetical protein